MTKFGYNTVMKVFKYKFTKLILSLIYAGIALSALVVGLTTYYLIVSDIGSAVNIVYPVLQYSLMYFVAVLLCVILISLLISSYYSIDGKIFKTSFGIIKSKYDVDKIESIILDRATNKLAVYFDENNFIVIVVKEEWYEEFIAALLKANPKIEYTINSKENDIDKKQ